MRLLIIGDKRQLVELIFLLPDTENLLNVIEKQDRLYYLDAFQQEDAPFRQNVMSDTIIRHKYKNVMSDTIIWHRYIVYEKETRYAENLKQQWTGYGIRSPPVEKEEDND